MKGFKNRLTKFIQNKFIFQYRTFQLDKRHFPVMILRNQGRAMIGIFKRIITIIGGNLSKQKIKFSYLIFRRLSRIAQKQGLPGLVKYLKSAFVLLQQSICGYRIKDSGSIGPRISRTKSGLPRIIPAPIRKGIRLGQTFWMRYISSIFSIYRNINIKGKLKLSTITDPYTGDDDIINEIIDFIPTFVSRFVTKPGKHLLQGKFKYFPIAKASPVTKWYTSHLGPQPMGNSTSPLALLLARLALSEQQVADLRTLYAIDGEVSASFARFDLHPSTYDHGSVYVAGRWLSLSSFKLWTGKLGLKEEAAGKIRVFAMVDPWTQMAMAPLHKGLFNILRKHRNIDGTFDQHRPLSRAWGYRSLFSMDLSSATDRLPIAIQTPLIQQIFHLTDNEAMAWKRLLVDRDYVLKQGPSSITNLRYAVGQPMGALSSWAMLAMTHHLLVQFCATKANRVSGSELYKAYAVLGDDIVIYDAKTAKHYHKVLSRLGVECNLGKSILSPKGIGLEFAKKTFYLGKDVSPVPLRELQAALTSPMALFEMQKKFGLSMAQILKVAGFGYKVLGGLTKPLSSQGLKVKFYIMTTWFNYPELLYYGFSELVTHRGAKEFSEMMSAFCAEYVKNLKLRVNAVLSSLCLSDTSFEEDSEAYYDECLTNFSKIVVPDFSDSLSSKNGMLLRDMTFTMFKAFYRPYYNDLVDLCRHTVDDQIPFLIRRAGLVLYGEKELPSRIVGWLKLLLLIGKVETQFTSKSPRTLVLEDPKRPDFLVPRVYNYHTAFMRIITKFSKMDQRRKHYYLTSGFNPLLIKRGVALLRPYWKRVDLVKLVRQRLFRVGRYSLLIGSMSYWFGYIETLTAVMGCLSILSSLIAGSMTTGSWIDQVWWYGCNILLHSFEILMGSLVVANVVNYQLTQSIALILLQNYSIQDGLVIFFRYQVGLLTKLSLDTADLAIKAAESVVDLSLLSQFSIGMIGVWLSTWFLRWFFGI